MKLDAKPILFLLGSGLLLGALAILASNENNVLNYRAAAMRHGGFVVRATRSGPTPGNDGEMVLVSGVPDIVKPAIDRQFGLRVDVPMLWRHIEMFQWRELDYGGTTTYEMDWIDRPIDSSTFRHPAHHHNPPELPFGDARYLAGEVRLGKFQLSRKIVEAIPGRKVITPDFSSLRPNLAASFRPYQGTLVTSDDPPSPQLGDLRVGWRATPLQTITVIAQNRNGTLVPADDVQDGAGFQLQVGKRKVVDLQPDLPAEPLMPWVWRVLAFVLAVTGARVLLWATPSQRSGWLASGALGVSVVSGMSGVMWVSMRADIGLLLIGAAALSLGVTAWHIYERVPKS